MRDALRICMLVGAVAAAGVLATAQQMGTARHWSIVVHGGAGVIERPALGPKGDAAYRAALSKGIEAGAKVLDQGGSALDAV